MRDDKTPSYFGKIFSQSLWKILLQLIVLISLVDLGVTLFFSNKNKIPVTAEFLKKDAIHKKTSDHLSSIVKKSDLIIGIQVTKINFTENRRYVIYTYIDNPLLNEIYDKFLIASMQQIPLLTNDEKNNKRIISLLNGEFICNPFSGSLASILVPGATKYVSHICALAIPPEYGNFRAILTVYTSRPPTELEVIQLRFLMKTLSSEIYTRDIK